MKDSADERGCIVVVDDEEIVLTSIHSFLNLETVYRVETFTSPEKALKFISENQVDLVISDYLMPQMDGIRFLSQVRDVKPEIPCIILTGYADKENAIKAINDVGLYQYIEKPWNNEDLLLILRNGLEKKQLMSKLQQKIDEISDAHGELHRIHREIMKTFV